MGTVNRQEIVWICLPRRAIEVVAHPQPTEITCLEGSLWLTLDHDPRDVVLNVGDAFVAPAHQRALVYALDDARLALRQPQGVATRTPAVGMRVPAGQALAA